MTRWRTGLAVAATIGALALSGCSSSSGSESSTTTQPPGSEPTPSGATSATGNGSGATTDLELVIASAVVAPTEEIAMYAVASQLGYYKDEGLKVTVQQADGSTAALQAISASDDRIVSGDAANIIAAAERGVPVKGVAAVAVNYPWRIGLLEDSPIKTAADLKGKSIGVISLASASPGYAKAFVKDAGLDPDNDVTLVPVGVGAQALTALQGGQVDALALFGQGYAVIENMGTKLRMLENPPSFDKLWSASLAASQHLMDSNPQALEAFLKASYKALVFSSTNPKAAMQLGYKEFPQLLTDVSDKEKKLADDTKVLEAWLESAALPGDVASWSGFGQITQERWDALNEFAKDAGSIPEVADIDDAWSQEFLDPADSVQPADIISAAKNYQP